MCLYVPSVVVICLVILPASHSHTGSNIFETFGHYNPSLDGDNDGDTSVDNGSNTLLDGDKGGDTSVDNGSNTLLDDDINTPLLGYNDGDTSVDNSSNTSLEGDNDGDTSVDNDINTSLEGDNDGDTSVDNDINTSLEGDNDIDTLVDGYYNDSDSYTLSVLGRHRSKRFDYEDLHEWSDDGSLEYNLDGESDDEDLTLWDKIGKNWQTVATRGFYMLVVVCMMVLIGCCCLKTCCRMACYSLRQNCVPCGGFLELLTFYYEDPMYKRAKDMAELFGLKLDYQTFLKIKERYDMGSEGPYNPLGLPHMG